MSQIETARLAIVGAITAAMPTGVAVVPVNSLDDFKLVLRQPPAVGVAYAAKQHDPHPKVIGSTRQSVSEWHFEVYVAAPGPEAGIPTGPDVFTLLEAADQALEGLTFTLGSQMVQLHAAGDQFVDLLVGALLYVQGWKFWQQG